MDTFFICGIGTGVGKTIISAIIVEKLGAAYWKPVQTGKDRDLHTVRKLVSNPRAVFIEERFRLKKPTSPHIAAKEENIYISDVDLNLPQTKKILIIEGAGGIMVPLNYDKVTFLDIIKLWHASAVIVSHNYLGSINHTLLTYKVLKAENIRIKGIIFNGEPNESSEEIIEKITKIPVLLKVKQEPIINKEIIKEYSKQLIWE